MQSVSSRIWTRVAVSNSYDDNDYTTGTTRNPYDALANMLDCNIVVSKFQLQSTYYIHFKANTFRKGMNVPIPPSYGLNCTTTVLLQR